MDNILLDRIYYGVRAVHYMQGKQYKVRYERASDRKFIGDMPIQGLSQPWTEETLRFSVTRLFADNWEYRRRQKKEHGEMLHEFFFDFEKGVIKYG